MPTGILRQRFNRGPGLVSESGACSHRHWQRRCASLSLSVLPVSTGTGRLRESRFKLLDDGIDARLRTHSFDRLADLAVGKHLALTLDSAARGAANMIIPHAQGSPYEPQVTRGMTNLDHQLRVPPPIAGAD